jgi:serpin B
VAAHSTSPRAAVAHCGEFGLALLKSLVGTAPHNVCISPVCLALTLLLAGDGAAGATREELGALLDIPANPDELCDAGRSLNEALRTSGGEAQIATANALFVAAGISLDPGFVERAARCHGAQARTMTGPAAAADTINAWVEEHTGGRIAAVIAEAQDESGMDCVLVSAVFFRALWQQPFDARLTREGVFNAPAGPQVVQLMTNTGRYGYFETAEFQAVTLGFDNGALGMDIVLPRTGVLLHEVIAPIRADRWIESMQDCREAVVEIVLPRCDVQYGDDMRTALSALGVRSAFTHDADFSAMGLQGHFIRRVQHEVRLQLDEEGAEAAAASAAVMTRSLARRVRMCIDRPFLYAIRQRATGCLLFIGAMFEPA